MPHVLDAHDAVVVIDVQLDFCPGGALAVPDGDAVVATLNRWIADATDSGATVVITRDWHPADHLSFEAQGGPWPTHCVAGTPGAAFHPDLVTPPDAVIIDKGDARDDLSYSCFAGTSLAEQLRRRGVRRVWVGGLALDYCVRTAAIDALAAGLEVHLLLDATRAVNLEPGDGDRAVAAIRETGGLIETTEP